MRVGRFTDEFKRRAVDLVLKQAVSASQAARDLGVYESSLGNWVKQAKIDQGKGPPDALTSEELAELRQLREEVKILREEREILKKAAAFFTKEKG